VHSPHVNEKKSWKTYLFEFFMLFLAVFCGFLAEYQLEHLIERDREKDFIISIVKEMKLDMEEIRDVQKDSFRYQQLFVLGHKILDGDRSEENIKQIYKLYFQYAGYGSYVLFKRSTISQLKNAGNMRLIKKDDIVNKIIGLDGSISHSFNVLEACNKYAYDNLRLGARIFNSKYKYLTNPNQSIKFITNDEKLLIEFANNIFGQAAFLKSYHNNCLTNHELYSRRLIDYFIKEYRLEKEFPDEKDK
jgi:hypothetical protein